MSLENNSMLWVAPLSYQTATSDLFKISIGSNDNNFAVRTQTKRDMNALVDIECGVVVKCDFARL